MRRYLTAVVVLLLVAIVSAGAVAVQESRPGPVLKDREFNATGPDLANQTIPQEFAASPTPIEVGVEITGTRFPGQKGEMAAGPRSIGIATNPASIVVIVVVIIAAAGGIWYLVRRRAADGEEGGKEQ